MLSSWTKGLLALLFAPLFAICLMTASGCEGEDLDNGVDNRDVGEYEDED